MRSLIPWRHVVLANLIVLLAGCGQYDVTINEKLVYGPKRLFRDFELADPSLHACVSQAIADQQVDDPLDLTALNCSNAGVERLDGLAIFAALKQVKLSDNRIRNLVELEQIAGIEQLWLDGNAIIDPVPLDQLGQLALLDLSGNPKLQCPKAHRLKSVTQLTLPEHCSRD